MLQLQDKDLISVQEVRNLLKDASAAQKELATFSQEKIDSICKAMADAAYSERIKLAQMAREETGFGIWQDKVVKNSFASKSVWENIKDKKTVGIINEDTVNKVTDVAVPVGVVAGLIPSTNPTSTVIYKALISIKAGNGIVFSPHPNALGSILETVKIIKEAAVAAGCPAGAIGCMTTPTIQGTAELMKHNLTNLILATGGSAMVKAAYSSGTPAIGVGPGNGPAFIERSANIPLAVKRIMDSKTFDNGTICASEQSVVVEEVSRAAVIAEFKKNGAYFLSTEEAAILEKFIMRANGSMNPQIVGKSVAAIAELTGLNVPEGTRVLIAEETKVGAKVPYSREKLAPILAFYTTKSWEEACELSIDILNHEGAGHTLCLHTEDQNVVREFGLRKPVSRLIVNAPGALGGIGAATNMAPALTLGCGAVGGSSTSDNISPENLFNIRRVAYGVRELEELRGEDAHLVGQTATPSSTTPKGAEDELVNKIVDAILAKL
ncbi:acetaldehyde dehydrogenase (acetylating) [Vagococcus intermedius]|uniref:Acetaldehyde dehydrogenase (Acetylating) n=1 Tax=Vagococcus intermedius TaxID=2991418 RepID=A0AAF0I563_9ENTE|nr:acetaldehyde dehydrogenase (acetylating) [Vagococcus intermedius]WEG72778.1 acetaldehyde dehydrogenase (acetylating) [Vagococcus intermedius]WEG74863.1 acetaldehyde dehydrogenase (acetylating) [Vagococcus intermedius]